jgi:hypothetical protein
MTNKMGILKLIVREVTLIVKYLSYQYWEKPKKYNGIVEEGIEIYK